MKAQRYNPGRWLIVLSSCLFVVPFLWTGIYSCHGSSVRHEYLRRKEHKRILMYIGISCNLVINNCGGHFSGRLSASILSKILSFWDGNFLHATKSWSGDKWITTILMWWLMYIQWEQGEIYREGTTDIETVRRRGERLTMRRHATASNGKIHTTWFWLLRIRKWTHYEQFYFA